MDQRVVVIWGGIRACPANWPDPIQGAAPVVPVRYAATVKIQEQAHGTAFHIISCTAASILARAAGFSVWVAILGGLNPRSTTASSIQSSTS